MEKIHISLVLEILGRPKEHIKEALRNLVTRMASEKDVKMLNKEYHDPVPAENSKDLFTTFAEIELELVSLEDYLAILFTYMPAHVEVISPEKLTITNSRLNELGNALIQRLHHYDALTKRALVDKDLAINKLKQIAPHLFTQSPKQEAKEEKPKKKTTKKTKKKK